MSAVLVTISDLTWSLQNNLTGIFGLDWTVNRFFSVFKRLGDQHALRDAGSSEFVSAKHAGNWGLRRGGLLSPRGRVWTFQHLVWTTPFDLDELQVAHVFVPDEADPSRVPSPTFYGTVMLVEPQGTLDGKPLDLSPERRGRNLPFLLQGSTVLVAGLRGWTRAGGRAVPVFPGSLVPHFPAGGLHLDEAGSALTDTSGADRHGGQLAADVQRGATSFDLTTSSSGFNGNVAAGDPFVVEGDTQVYVATAAAFPAGNTVANVTFTPPAAQKWEKGADLDFRNAFATPAPQTARLTELEPDGTIVHGKIERQALLTMGTTGLAVADGQRFYVVDPAGVGSLATVARAAETAGSTRIRFSGDGVSGLGRVSVKLRGIAATPGGEATPHLTRVDDRKLGVPTPSPPYAKGDVLQLADASLATPLITAITGLRAEIEIDDTVPRLAASGTVALLDVVPGEAERDAKLAEGGKVVDFAVDPAHPPAAPAPAVGSVLLVTATGPGAARTPAIVDKAVAAQKVRLDRSVGADGDAVKVRTLTRKDDLGTDPVVTGTTLAYVPAAPAKAPAADTFVLVDAHTKVARRVASVTFDGVLVDQTVPATAASPTATRFPGRVSKIDGDSFSVAPIWIFTGAGVGNAVKALALRGYPAVPPPAGAPIVLAGATVNAGTVSYTPGAAPGPSPGVGELVRATVGAATVLALVKRIELDVTLDRALGAELAATGLDVVPIDLLAPEYTASARDALVVTAQPEMVGAAGVQLEMPRFRAGELVLVNDTTAAPPVARSYRIAAVAGTTLTLEAGPAPLAGPFPKAVTVRRLDAVDPQTGTTRAGRDGAFIGGNRAKLRAAVWRPDGVGTGMHVAVVDAAHAAPAVVTTVDALRIVLATDGALANGAVTLDVPAALFTGWSAAVDHDGNDLVLDDVVVARAGATHDVAVVPYVASARVVPGRLSPGTTKVPDTLEDRYDLDRYEALIEHELHHTVQSAELGPLLLSLLPMWAVELIAETIADAGERAQFTGDLAKYQSAMEAISVGGVLDLLVGGVYGGLLWLILLAVHGINELVAKDDGKGPLDFLDPFALDYFPATVPDPAHKDTIALQPHDGSTLQLAAGDRVQLKKPSDSRPLQFFTNRYTVKAVNADGTVTLDSSDLPLEGNATSIAKVPGAQDDPLHTADNSILRGFGLGWMSILFDPYGELDFRVQPDRGSFADVLLRVARYAFGTRSWGLVMFSGFAFWDNLRRQWGFLSANNPHLATMERGSSYASGDTYYPMGLLRASGDEATALSRNQFVVGDVAQAWFLPSGGSRRELSVIGAQRLAAPGVAVGRTLCQMPYVDVPAAPNLALQVNQGAQTDPAVADSALAVPDTFVDKQPNHFRTPGGAPAAFVRSDRGSIPVSAEMERTAGAYVAFCRPGDQPAKLYKHRVTLRDGVSGGDDAREAFEVRGIDLIHDLGVSDVIVRIGGRKVTEGGELVLLPFERARVEVTPNGARRYDVTVTRPADGDVRRMEPDLSLAARKTAAPEPVEVSRVYRYVDGRGFDGGGLQTWGLHVPTDVHVPVRRFKAKVDTALAVRKKADPDEPTVATLKPGDTAHLLVPVRLRPAPVGGANPRVTPAFVAAGPAGSRVPRLAADLALVNPATEASLKSMFAFDGRVVSIALPVDDPPEGDVRVDVAVDVGPGPDAANTATCTAQFTLQPHFTLTRVGGGADFNVAGGATIGLECSGGVHPGTVTLTPAHGMTTTTSPTGVEVKVPAGTPAGAVRVLVADKDHPTQKAVRTITVT